MKPTPIVFFFVALTVAAILADPGHGFGTTFKQLTFNEILENSDLVIEGRVISLQVVEVGQANKTEKSKSSGPPEREYVDSDSSAEEAPGNSNRQAEDVPAPIGADFVEGNMLFTEVTILVETEIIGLASERVTFQLPGGDNGQFRAIVFGIPEFEIGQRYIVFLQPDFETALIPITGVNQGYFRIVPGDLPGEDIVLNATGDIVSGVENGMIVVQRNPIEPGAYGRRLGPAPEPLDENHATARTSPEVAQFWSSEDPPMSIDDFLDAIWEIGN